MKKIYKDIILGILIGTVAFGVLAIFKPAMEMRELRAEAESLDAPLTSSGTFSWLTGKIFSNPNYRLDYDDVFGNPEYLNLYLMMNQFILVEPEDEALKEMARNYGLTVAEAAAVRDGSSTPFTTMLDSYSSDLTQQQVMNKVNNFRDEYEDIHELYSLQQELNVSSASSELFSNGVVTDSGFDLVHDLTVIEQILFAETSEQTVGGPLTWGQKEADGEIDPKYYLDDPDSYPAISQAYYALELKDTGEEDEAEDEVGADFEGEVLVEILEEDVCPKEGEVPIEDAIGDYEEEATEYFEQQMLALGIDDIEDLKDASEEKIQEAVDFFDSLEPAKAAEWRRELDCKGKLLAEGSAAADDEDGQVWVSAAYYICLEGTNPFTMNLYGAEIDVDLGLGGIPVKWNKYSSYVSNDDCIQCEFEKILAYMRETLSHSLAPNKVTGNYMETTKCKKSMDTPLIDLQFIVMYAPPLTPPNDDAIYGKNIVTEWAKFIKRTNPYALQNIGISLLPEYTKDKAAQWVDQNSGSDEDLAQIIQKIGVMSDKFATEKAEALERYEIESAGEDFVIYSQSVMQEVGQMTLYFKNFMDMFQTVAEELCPAIANKDYVD